MLPLCGSLINPKLQNMRKLLFIVIIPIMIFSCEKNQLNIETEYLAEITGFDPNCSLCILQFPDDESLIRKNVGESPGNFYLAANLSRGDYAPGQKLKVTIRKAKEGELSSCSKQNPNGYQSIIVTGFEKIDEISLNDTIDLPYRECRFFREEEFYLCLDSVMNDSRCPYGAYCFWEGNAVARFRYERLSGDPVFFNLNTHHQFRTDTVIDGYVFSFAGLSPWPVTEPKIEQKSYIARIIVERE